MIAPVFVDTVFLIALQRPRDQHRPRSLAWREMLNALADPATRKLAAEFCDALVNDPGVQVVRWTDEAGTGALSKYRQNSDKGYGLTDCLSFWIMEKQQLQDALTSDRHFQQAGFRALLLEEPPQ